MASKDTKLNIIIDAQNKANAAFNSVRGNLDAIKKDTQGMNDAMKAAGVVGTAAFLGISTFIGGSLKSLGAAQLAIAKVDATLAAMNRTTDGSRERIMAASKAVVRLGFDDEAAAVSITKLFQVTNDLNKAIELNAVAMDLARNKNIDLETAGRMVQLVLAGNARALKEYGIELDETKTPMEALTQLQGMLAGQAEAATGSLTVQGQVLSETFSNLQDSIASTLAPMLTDLLNDITPLIEKMTEWIEANPELTKQIVLWTLAVTGVMAVLLPLAIALPGIILMVSGLATAVGFLAASFFPLLAIGVIAAVIVAAFTSIKDSLSDLSGHWDQVWLGMELMAADVANAIIYTVESVVNYIISGINTVIKAINKVVSMAQDIPGIGKSFKTLDLMQEVSIQRIDPSVIAADHIQRQSSQSQPSTTILMTGNMLLDQDAAQKMGDLLMQRLKLSNAL